MLQDPTRCRREVMGKSRKMNENNTQCGPTLVKLRRQERFFLCSSLRLPPPDLNLPDEFASLIVRGRGGQPPNGIPLFLDFQVPFHLWALRD